MGRELGLPEIFVGRHPFPGPGLAIRCPGDITKEKLDILRNADAVYIDQIRKAGLYDQIWQAFAVLLPVKTVGVMGDGRTYEYVVGLRAVTSTDGMTADFYPFDMKFLGETATRIINEVKGVNRVVYDVTSKPPGTVRMEDEGPLGGNNADLAAQFGPLLTGLHYQVGVLHRAHSLTSRSAQAEKGIGTVSFGRVGHRVPKSICCVI